MGHKRVSPKFTHKECLIFGRNINSTVNYIIAIDKNNCAHAVKWFKDLGCFYYVDDVGQMS